MIWEEIRGEMLTYNGAESEDLLRDRDMYVQDGHLREMVSLDDCIDYGPIKIGDKVLLYSGQTYILRNMDARRD